MEAVVDTSVLLLPFTERLDLMGELERLFGHVEPVLVDSVRAELDHLAKGDGATARAATAAIRWTSGWSRGSTDLPGDDGVLEVARRVGAVVVSNDRSMQAEAARSGLRVAIPRGHGLALM